METNVELNGNRVRTMGYFGNGWVEMKCVRDGGVALIMVRRIVSVLNHAQFGINWTSHRVARHAVAATKLWMSNKRKEDY